LDVKRNRGLRPGTARGHPLEVISKRVYGPNGRKNRNGKAKRPTPPTSAIGERMIQLNRNVCVGILKREVALDRGERLA